MDRAKAKGPRRNCERSEQNEKKLRNVHFSVKNMSASEQGSSQEGSNELPLHQPSASLSFEESGRRFSKKGPMFVDVEAEEDDDEDVEEEESEVDLEAYFDRKGVDVPKRVGICRAYASYMVSLGGAGRERRGPSPRVGLSKTAIKRSRQD